jgi:hypothetical protein
MGVCQQASRGILPSTVFWYVLTPSALAQLLAPPHHFEFQLGGYVFQGDKRQCGPWLELPWDVHFSLKRGEHSQIVY